MFFAFVAAVFAGLAIDTDVVVPVGMHESIVAVAQRTRLQGCLAGAGRLQHTGAPFQSRRAVVVAIAVGVAVRRTRLAPVTILLVWWSELFDFDGGGLASVDVEFGFGDQGGLGLVDLDGADCGGKHGN